MTTKSDFTEELKLFLIDKRQEFNQESDEEFMQWSEGYDQPDNEFYEISKKEGNKILKNHGEIIELIDEIEDFINNF